MKRHSVHTVLSTIKQGSVSLLSLLGAGLGAFTLIDALTGDLVIMESLQVPPPFEAKGYTGEIATQQLLDEIARLNSLATLSRERKNYGDKALFDSIARSDAAIAGVDIKLIRATIQKAFGREPTRISGEIAMTTIDGKNFFTVRLRSNPPRRLLVDIKADGEPVQVLERAALALLEKLDPIIAMSVYRLWNDHANALRMADAALTNADPNDDGAAIQQRSFVYAALRRFDLAEADARSASGFSGHAALANLYREMGRYDESLAEAERAIAANPKVPQGYFHKGRVLLLMKQTEKAIEVLQASSAMFPESWPNHHWLGMAQVEKGDFEAAKLAFGKTLALAPKQVNTQFALAEVEKKLGNHTAALAYYRQAYELAPQNPLYLIALLEAENSAGSSVKEPWRRWPVRRTSLEARRPRR